MPLIVRRESDLLPVFKDEGEDISTACPHENLHETDDMGDTFLQGYELAVSINPTPTLDIEDSLYHGWVKQSR